jgi:RHS repeat-associated protein
MDMEVRQLSRVLAGLLGSAVIASGSTVALTTDAQASSPVDPGVTTIAHKAAAGAAVPQPPLGTVVGKRAPSAPTPQTALPAPEVEAPQPLDLGDMPAYPPTTVGGFDPSTSVELPSERTVDTTVFLNANGTRTAFAYNGPVHYKDALGTWQNVDQTLELDRVAGTFHPKAVGVGLALAANTASGALASLSIDSGHVVAYRLDGAASADAWVSGATAKYLTARTATDVELVALANGVKETLVLKSKSAPTSFTFPLALTGVSPSIDPGNGDIVYSDGAGREWARTPHASMTDSAINGDTGEGATSDGVTYAIVPYGTGLAVRLTIDSTWLNDPSRVFPVRVDPTVVTKLSDSDDTYVQTGYTANNSTETEVKVGTPDSTPHTAYTYLHFGGINSTYNNYFVTGAELDLNEVHSWTCTPKSWTVHNVTSSWAGSTVKASAQPSYTSTPIVSYSSAKGDTCGGAGWDEPDITSAVQAWTHGTTNYGLTVRPGSATDVNYWKRFASYQADPTNHSSAPQIKFTYASQGAKYALVGWQSMPTNTTNGKFRITVTNWGHDAWPANGSYRLGYHLYDNNGNLITFDGTRTLMPTTVNPRQAITLDATVGKLAPGTYRIVFDMVQESVAWFSQVGVPPAPATGTIQFNVTNQAPAISKVNSPADLAAVTTNRPTLSVTAADTDNYPSGGALQYAFHVCKTAVDTVPSADCLDSTWISSSSWTVPANWLYYRQTYYWHAFVKDSGGAQRNPNWWFRFTPVVSDTSAGAHFGADPYGINDGGVDVSVGSYVTSAVEAPVATIGPPLAVTRTYNSGDSRIGAFGTGWSSLYDMSATADPSGNVTVVHADGRRALYGKNPDGSYAASYGFYSTLASMAGGGWTLTDKGANVYTFSAAGKLVNVKDPAGRQLTLTDDGAGHTTVTDVTSGRTLTLTWTGAHVSSAATASVAAAGGPLVWQYGYTGDNLSSACDPRNKCVTYAYGGTGGRLSAVTLPRGNTPEQIHYASDGTVDWRKDGRGKQWTYTRVAELVDPAGGMRITVLDPRNNATVYLYDAQTRLVRRQDPNSHTRTYGYDTATGFLSAITDENGNTLTLMVDDRGNVLSRSVPYGDVPGLVATSYYGYINEPGSPRDNKINVYRDARSADANDSTYAVSYVYSSSNGQITTLSTPPTTAFPSGTSTTWAYTSGSEAAVGSTGTQPAGLLATETDPRGFLTTYSYNSKGDLTRIVDREGLRTDYAYDELGRLASETAYPTNYPGGLTTTYRYDLSGVIGTVTGPGVLDPRTNVTHTRRTTNVPDANGVVRDVTVSDLTGGDVARATHVDVDENDNVTLVRDPEGGTTVRTYDDAENVATVNDPRGQLTQYDYDANNRVTTVTAKSFVDDPITPGTPHDVVLARYGYDPGGRLASVTDARSVQRTYSWYGDDRLKSVTLVGYHNLDGTTRDVVTEWHRYDMAGNEITTKLGGYLRTIDSEYDQAGWLAKQTEDQAILNRTVAFARDAAGNVTSLQRRQVSDSGPTEETRYAYDNGGNIASVTVENGATDLLTVIQRNNRGQVTGVYDPRGTANGTPYNDTYLTSYNYDGLGRLLDTTGGSVTAEEGGTNPTTGRPQTLFGYDTFGERTRVVDPRGKTYVTSYDKAGRPKVVTWPSYTPPGGSAMSPTETYGYNAVGDLTSVTDRRGNTTTFDYDTLGRLVRRTQPKPDATQTNPVARWTYDPNGNVASAVDPTGARTEYAFDDRNQLRNVVDVVRNGTSAPTPYTTTYGYDDLGNVTQRVEPRGETTYADYNADSELIQIQDGAGNLWKTGRDVAGRVVKRTDPIGRYQTTRYDLAGRATSLAAYNPANALVHTENATYDGAGNLASYTPSASGPGVTTAATRTYAFDAVNQLTSMTEPTTTTHSVTTSFGYDLAGNRTRITDGNNHSTTTTYDAWELPETVTEPLTTAFPALADRTWTTTYNASGTAVRVDKPGGVSVTRTLDALGRLTAETGSGASGTRALGYDLAGRLTSAGHPSGTETFGYDDRGLLTSASGPAGAVTNGYDEDGRLSSRTDAAGTTSFTYDPRDIPATITDPLTGQTQTIAYWSDGQIKTRQWGTNGAKRSYTYDDQGRLAGDSMTNPSNTVAASYAYTYDGDGNVATRTISGPGISGAGTHTYGYDLADRLTSWTSPGGTKTYAYDDAGNRTSAAGKTYSYDERNRLVSDSAGGGYSYTARGTQATGPGGTTLTADAFDRTLTDSASTFAYDSLDRVATQGTTTYGYDGTDPEPANIGTSKVARDPYGQLVATNVGAAGSVVMANPHGDVNALIDPSNTVTNGSRSYDPFGLASTSGSSNAFGFQGQASDAAGRVHMQSRWYDPGSGTFTSRDTFAMSASRAGGANRYAYGLGNPATLADPSGHGCIFGACLPDIGTEFEHIVSNLQDVAEAGAGIIESAEGAAADGIGGALAAGGTVAVATAAFLLGPLADPAGYENGGCGAWDVPCPEPQYGSSSGSDWDRDNTPHGHYHVSPGDDPTEPKRHVPLPVLHLAGPPPDGGPGSFRPITIDPRESTLTFASAPTPAPAPVTGPIADDTSPCGQGGTVAKCGAAQSALTRGCDLDAVGAMRQCEPVVPKTSAGQGGGGRRRTKATANGGCDSIGDAVDPDCAKSAAELAAAEQGSVTYPGVDAWENVVLKKGTVVYAGEPGVSGFATSEAVAAQVGNDATALNQGLQISAYEGSYRPGLTAFRLLEDVEAARSIAAANPQFGPGGLEQLFIPNLQQVSEPLVTRLMFPGGMP